MNSDSSLAEYALSIVVATDPDEKVRLAIEAETEWRQRRIVSGRRSKNLVFPAMPGRPPRPVLLPPRDMPRRRASSKKGLIALVHALAHIELNAIDMSWDLVGRFATAPLPSSFLDEAVRIGGDEARHYSLIERRLRALGAEYGDLPAHGGLWEAVQRTGDDLMARLAIVPLVLEARGLDVTPQMIGQVEKAGDFETAAVMRIIYEDEITHVAFGAKWFRYLCHREKIRPEPAFHDYLRQHFRGALKPPFNEQARAEAGLTPGFYRPLTTANKILP